MYQWAINKLKLQRAEAMLPGQSEEAVKQAYIKLGGKVDEVPVETKYIGVANSEPHLEEVSADSINKTADVEINIIPSKKKSKK